MDVCPFCLEPVTSVEARVRAEGDDRDWHRECWNLEHVAEPVDFDGTGGFDRDVVWLARGGKRGAGL